MVEVTGVWRIPGCVVVRGHKGYTVPSAGISATWKVFSWPFYQMLTLAKYLGLDTVMGLGPVCCMAGFVAVLLVV